MSGCVGSIRRRLERPRNKKLCKARSFFGEYQDKGLKEIVPCRGSQIVREGYSFYLVP